MKPINELTDHELAEAVAVEVLGLFTPEQKYWIAPWCDDDELGLAAYWRTKEPHGPEIITVCCGILNAQGRERIEDEMERRGWDYEFGYSSQNANPEIAETYNMVVFSWRPLEAGGGRQWQADGPLHKNKYRAIAEAALMAVRGEK